MSFSKIGLIVVGDEILSGQRQDKHVTAVIERLQERGLVLSWVQIVGDDRTYLTEVLRRSLASDHLVLSCGGIGATPDDHTRQAAAAALGCPLVRHPEAVALIRQRCAENQLEADEFRLRMADFPEGAALIPNAYNKIPGFSVGQHYFVPGFPVMAWPMIEWVLDHYYSHLHHQQRSVRCALRVYKTMEADLTPLMEVLEQAHPACTLYSLPCVGDESMPAHIELGVKARGGVQEAEQAQSAFDTLQQELARSGRLFEVLDVLL